jgi:hypothetical protein
MREEDRIREMTCGCRYDVVTGYLTFVCEPHSTPMPPMPPGKSWKKKTKSRPPGRSRAAMREEWGSG